VSAVRAAIHVSIATGAKLLAGLIVMKLIAVRLGPTGLGQLGNFMNVVAMLNVAACGGITIGVTRYVAEFQHNDRVVAEILRKAVLIALVCTAAIALPTFVFSSRISTLLFGTESFGVALRVGTLLILPIGLAAIGVSVANGFSDTRSLAYFQVATGLLGVGGLYLLLEGWGVRGAVLGLLWISACPFLPTVLWWYRKHHIRIRDATGELALTARSLTRYGALTLYTILLQNGSSIKVRSILANTHGWSEVGVWQAMTRLSDAYLQVILVFLAAYTLPRLAAATTKTDSVRITIESYRYILSALVLILGIGYSARYLVIKLLLTAKFQDVSSLFLPQMLGDFFKIAAYIPGYLALAKGSTRLLLIGEPVQVALMITSTYLLAPSLGAIGVTYAYLCTYVLYSVVTTAVFLIYVRRPDRREVVPSNGGGIASDGS
jgi:O-antigen/teichoic acid export membrane protein